MQGLNEFIEFVRGRPEVQASLEESLGSQVTDGADLGKITALASVHGYRFTEAELDERLDSLVRMELVGDELSELQLDLVAGGTKGENVACLVNSTLGKLFGASLKTS